MNPRYPPLKTVADRKGKPQKKKKKEIVGDFLFALKCLKCTI